VPLESRGQKSKLQLALTVATPGALPSAFVVYREPLATGLPKIAAMGYDGVELALLDRSQVDMAELRTLLDSTGLSVPMVSTGQIFAAGRSSFASADQAVRSKAEELFAGLVDVAAELGAMINVGRVRGAVEGNGDRRGVEARVADSLRRMTELAGRSGVQIALEPVNRYEIDFLNSCAEAVSFMERHQLDALRLMPDIFHMNIEDPSIEGSLMRFVDRIGYVHFADSNRHFPGAGHQDFRSIISALRTAGYEGWIGAEILPFPDPDTAARNTIEYLRRFL
jgi:sugar phosphate isomerase/epimerase